MLLDTYTLGTGGTSLLFAKQFPDANNSRYSVAGLALNAARTLTVSHQTSSDGSVRTMVSLDETDVDPGSTSGQTKTSRVYLVIQRSSFKSAADVKATITRLKTLVDNTTFQDSLLNREV